MGRKFVIHKHDATNLHYDFRIAVDGVLKSWTIPKGPSTNPSIKRLAMQTDDHSMKYGRFEGVIPEGKYGAGTVMIWDMGTYKNLRVKSMKQCLKEGLIEVWLTGKKLNGGYALVKIEPKKWLLVKMKDEFAKKGIRDKTKSAITSRTMKEIAKKSSQR